MKSKNIIIAVLVLIILNFSIAIIPHLIVKPLWVPRTDGLKIATIFEALYTLVILPLILLYLNKKVNKKLRLDNFLINSIFILVAIYLSSHFHYQNFADMTGKGDNPDQGTYLMKVTVLIGGMIISIIGIGLKLRKDKKKKINYS
ncbi:hypothetical protein [Aquimarina sp. SS2-1]|uniref:hypothetical protein n=1 Tax=Aquimarina besae TaxID=3342247 RepID=UPI00366FA93D